MLKCNQGDEMKIEKYIEKFSDLINSEIEMVYDNNISMPYVQKPKCVHEFLSEVYDTIHFDKDYENNIQHIISPFEINSPLTKEDNITVLTYCVRKDRFIEGFLMESIISGLMSKLLLEYCQHHYGCE